jgi:cyclopropane fatty-acyl-phospholipid synthase-like methyltransferase
MREYDLIADCYATESRGRAVAVAEALAVAAMLPGNSRLLDVGCGNGVLITQALVNNGRRVLGFRQFAGMLAHFQPTCRTRPWSMATSDVARSQTAPLVRRSRGE